MSLKSCTRSRAPLLVALAVPVLLFLTGCGGSSSNGGGGGGGGSNETITATSGTPQSVAAGTAFALLQVTVKTNGTGTGNVTVTFTAPSSGASGVFADSGTNITMVTTGPNGVANAPTFTANSTAGGPYTVTATVAGVATAATFSLTNLAGTTVITPTSGSGQGALLNATFLQPLAVTVTTGTAPTSNFTVTFAANQSSGASGNFPNGATTDVEVTDSSGVATSKLFTANGSAGGPYTISATGSVGAANFFLTNVASSSLSLAATAGTTQSAAVSTAFGTKLTATVMGNGVAVGGVTVVFSAPALGASGTFANGTATDTEITDVNGNATSTTFTADSTSGAYVVAASIPGALATPANFNLTNTGVSIAATAGANQIAILGSAFATQLAATVTTNGSPTSGVTVTFTAPSSQSSASGTFSGGATTATAVTDTFGVAIAPVFTANSHSGSYSVTASAPGSTAPASFSLTNISPVIVATAGTPQTATVNTNFGTQLQATVLTAASGGSPVPGVTVTFTAPSSGAGGTFAGGGSTDAETTNALGIATATLFKANGTAGSDTVTATTPGAPNPADFFLTNAAAVTLKSGNYVFSLSGFDANGFPYSLAGVFTVASNSITGGELDFVDYSFADNDRINSAGSSISTATDGNLLFTLAACYATDCTTTDPNLGVGGVVTLDASFLPQNSNKAFVIEFDSSATSSGTLDFQTSTVAPAAGGYAFGLEGLDTFATPMAMGGVLNITSSGTISVSGSVFDANDDEVLFPGQTFTGGTVFSPDTFGRVEFTLNPTDANDFPQMILAGYIVDADHIRLVETADTFLGALGGTALGQGANTGTFNSASVSGKSYVVGLTGSDAAGALQAAGLLTFNSGGTVTGFINYNDLTGLEPQTPSPITGGTYAVDPTGDVTLTGVTDGKITFNLQLYLDGNGNLLTASMDSTDVLGGRGYQQTGGGSFTSGSFSGAYGVGVTGWDKNSFGELDATGLITATGSGGTFTGAVDLNWLFLMPSPAEAPNLPVSGVFTSNADGIFTGTINGLDVTTCPLFLRGPGCTNDVFNYYLYDAAGDSIAIETDTMQVSLGFFAQK